jgi:hypothetical protein
MIVLAVIAAVWLLLTVLILAACRAARLGDQAQQPHEPLRSVAPEPAAAEVTVRRRRRSRAAAAILPSGAHSSQDLSMR